MIKFTIDHSRIPLSINPCPIVDTILEIRYSIRTPLEVMVGMIYEKLQQKNEHSLVGEPQRLPINDVPLAVRDKDENLKNQPHYVIDYNGLSFRIAMTNVSVAIKDEYSGWENFSNDVRDFIAIIDLIGIIKVPLRIGLRYVSFFKFNIFEKIQVELKIFDNKTLSATNAILTNWNDGDISCTLQVANNVTVSKNNQIMSGSIIDVDVATKDGTSIDIAKIDEILEALHKYEKQVFFNLLSETFLESLNPVYS